MATLASEMPPLHTVEALAGVTSQASSQPPIGGGSVGGGVGSAVGQPQQEGIDSTQSPEMEQQNNSTSSITTANNTNNNNTISAAADSSDNQPSTPQPHIPNGNDSQQSSLQSQQQQPAAHHPYANHHMYSNSQPTTTANSHLNHLYPQQIYATSNMDMQQQQQLQQPLTPSHHASSYPSYLNSYEQFYQQQQHQQQNPSQQQQQQQSHQSQNPQMDYINSNSNSNSMYSASEYKQQSGIRYHPYLNTPISGIPSVNSQNSNSNNALDANSQSAPVVSSASSSVMSPRVVSSTSPSSSSNQMQISGSASSIGSMSAGNPSSPAGTPQCKKCGIMCTNESELQEHIANVHGASPYGSSGYASSPYIKEELQQQQTPPSQSQQQQQQQQPSQQGVSTGGNPGEILDLDSQKMLYPPVPGALPMMHQSLANTDPLHGLHSMQQRAGMASWDQQPNEGLPPYLQQQPTPESKNLPNHSPYYQSPKQSPYHVSNSTNIIKSEYPIIKNEYPDDNQQYMSDKSFDPTAPGSQQMMPPAVSSSPAEFPSTTTGGPQDSQQQSVGNQQFRQGNFEPPTSSSTSVTGGAIGAKAANWKSNEARRPKTYNCTACNKWFTSSGHLKRHYNTTLHKNAVKSSGQPDPATLPISVHHHPARDPSGKATRRANAAAAAAAQANAQQQQQQQQLPPNPVQPPEPPNSPHDYGGPQTAAGGMTPLSHYAATPSPNSMYQQQQQYQQQHQYMPQVQSTTNASPQHASNMVGLTPTAHHQQQQQQLPAQTQQQTVMNGHPNALAGPSVPTTQQQTPMPSSQMRGLLNSTTTPTTTMHIVKTEYMEAANMEDLDPQQDQGLEESEAEELGHLTNLETVKEEGEDQQPDLQERSTHSAKGDLEEDLAEEEGGHREVDHNVVHHHTQPLPQSQHQMHYQLDHHQQQVDMERPYHNTTPSSTHSNMQAHSPHIISHQQYQEQLQQQQHQMVAQGTYTLTQTPSPPQQQHHHSIMEHQPYTNMPLSAINTQQHSNMQQLQPPPITMEQQLQQPDTTIPTTNTVNMLQPNHHMPPQQQPTELQPLHNIPLQPADTNTNIPHMLPSHITTSNITSIPSFHQLQQPGSVLQPLDHTLTYPHTIIGNALTNAEVLTLDAYGNLVPAPGQHQQVIQTSDGQIVHVISTGSSAATTLYSTPTYSTYMAQRSPQEGDLPPMSHHYNEEQTTTLTVPPSMAYSPNITSSSTNSASSNPEYEYKPTITDDYLNNNFDDEQDTLIEEILNKQEAQLKQKKAKATRSTTHSNKRKRNPSTSSSVGANSTILPSGRIKCLPCNKEFTKICYLTQHNKSFHSGEYPYRCQKCGKRYQSDEVYNAHLVKHKTTDKAHKCNICPKQFHHKTDLRRHIEAIHTGNKQHSCDICEKSFCRKDHLRKHLETHNRPRMLSKKSVKVKNKTITEDLAKAQIKSKDNTLIKPLSLSPIITSHITLRPASNFNETNSLSSVTTSTPSPVLQHIDDVAIDDDDLLEDEMDEYDANDMDEEQEYLTMQEYQEYQEQQQQLQNSAQYVIAKNVYQIIEQDLPIY